jgi:thioredoxin 1
MRSKTTLPLVAALMLVTTAGLLRAQVAWVARFDDALKQAKAEQKFMVVDISTSWCPPCQQMAREVHTNKDFIEFTRTQVFMLLDAEKDNDGIRLAGRFNVQAYPTILVLDSEGREIDRLIGGTGAANLIHDLKEIFANPLPFDQLISKARSQPDDFQIQFEAGKRAFQRQEYDKSRQYLSRAGKLSDALGLKERAETMSLLTAVCFKSGKYQDALSALDAMSRLDGGSAAESMDLKLLRARILVALNRDDEAFELMNAVLRASPSRGTKDTVKELLAEMPAKYRKGDREYENAIKKAQESLKKKKFDEALVLAARAEALAPQDPQAHLLIAAANIYGSAQEGDPARKGALISAGLHELRLARCLDREDMSSFLAAKGYLASKYLRFEANSPEAQKSFLEGETRFNEGRLKEATAAYAKTIQLDPGFGKAYLYMGDCYFRVNDLEGALKWYQQAVSKTPADAAAYRFTSDALAKLGRTQEADSALVLGLLADPEYPLIRAIRGARIERHASTIPTQFLLLSGDVDSFNESMFDSVPAETVPAWREYVRNKILWRQEKFQAAFPKESFYHATFEEELDCLNRLVGKWSAMKAADPALRNEGLDFLRQVSIDGHLDSFVYLELFTEEYRPTYEKWKQQDMEKARTYITRFLLGAPARSRGGYNSSAVEAFNAALASHRAGEREKAIEGYEKALAQEPNMIPALTNLSMLCLQQGELEKARALIKRWLTLEPESSQALAAMARLEAQGGNPAAAAELFQKAADLEQNPEQKANYLKNLEMLKPSSRSRPPVLQRPRPPDSPLAAAVAALNDDRWSEAINIL